MYQRPSSRRPARDRRTRHVVPAGLAALMFLLGTLFLAAPAQAVCEEFDPGTPSWASCIVAEREGTAEPVGEPSPGPTADRSAELWQLGVAGIVGAGIAVGATLGFSRLAQRQHATAQ